MRLSTPALAVTAGTLFAVTAGIDIPHHQPDPFNAPVDYLLEVVFCSAMAASAAATWTLLRSAGSRLARAGWSLVGLGYLVLTVVTGATAVNGGDVLGPLFAASLLAISLGCLTLFATDVAGRVTPKGAGVVVLVGLVAMIALGEGYGVLAWSAMWFAVAALSRTQLPRTSRDLTLASSAS